MERRNSRLDSFKGMFSRRSSKHESSRNLQPEAPMNQGGYDSFTSIPSEQPPAYTKTPLPPLASTPPASTSASARRSNSVEDEQFEFLRSFDTIFLIDDSTSMTIESRWSQVSRVLQQITPICTKYDADGVDLKFLNTKPKPIHSNILTASTVLEIFSDAQPSGATPIGTRLASILRPYMRRLEESAATGTTAPPKPVNIIVITDGEPTDDPEAIILQTAQRLDALDAEPWQVGIQFFQVGSNTAAKQYLEHLDDELASAGRGCRDIVDTVPFDGRTLDAETILKVVLGAVNKRLDRKKNVRRAAS